MGALCWGSYSGGIIQGQLSMVGAGGGGSKAWCQFSGGEFYEGKLSGDSYPGGIVTDFRLTKE